MTSRSIVPLTLLSLFVIAYVVRYMEDFGGLLENVQGKVKNDTIPSSLTTPNSSLSSLSEMRLDIDHISEGVEVPIVRGNDDLESTSNPSQLEKSVPTEQSTSAPSEAGNTTIVINAANETIDIDETPACCLRPSVDLDKKFSPEFFEKLRHSGIDPQTKWTGREYEEWVKISARLNPNQTNQTNLDCTAQYTLLVLDQVTGFYLRTVMTELGKDGKSSWLPYYEEKSGLPRILLLGDSISRGIRSQTQQMFHGKQANIQGAPANCIGFEAYQSNLKHWLGYCPWDIVQFNVGMHFHPEFPDNYTSWHHEYGQAITKIVRAIRSHSPSAHIVFALTTPSPFDTEATTPNRASCPHYDKFHKAGFVAAMNEVITSLSAELGIIINDRYSAILPVLGQYQKKCDVHYDYRGYQYLARQDWKVFSETLSLNKS